jgi:hypothetical protein
MNAEAKVTTKMAAVLNPIVSVDLMRRKYSYQRSSSSCFGRTDLPGTAQGNAGATREIRKPAAVPAADVAGPRRLAAHSRVV